MTCQMTGRSFWGDFVYLRSSLPAGRCHSGGLPVVAGIKAVNANVKSVQCTVCCTDKCSPPEVWNQTSTLC